jgi:hypothetical protein
MRRLTSEGTSSGGWGGCLSIGIVYSLTLGPSPRAALRAIGSGGSLRPARCVFIDKENVVLVLALLCLPLFLHCHKGFLLRFLIALSVFGHGSLSWELRMLFEMTQSISTGPSQIRFRRMALRV